LRNSFYIDRLRCCACNASVEVCPVKCLRMDAAYAAPAATRDKDVFHAPPNAAKEGTVTNG
jgi:formate hydrogenlyase subunit 6/NADH:ubiquinone oxidoreductase subunit I